VNFWELIEWDFMGQMPFCHKTTGSKNWREVITVSGIRQEVQLLLRSRSYGIVQNSSE